MASEPTSTPPTETSTPEKAAKEKWRLVITDKKTGREIWHGKNSLEDNRASLKKWAVEKDAEEDK